MRVTQENKENQLDKGPETKGDGERKNGQAHFYWSVREINKSLTEINES